MAWIGVFSEILPPSREKFLFTYIFSNVCAESFNPGGVEATWTGLAPAKNVRARRSSHWFYWHRKSSRSSTAAHKFGL